MTSDRALELLDRFEIETPSWGYADTGTRFGKFFQPGAAVTIEEKISDAAAVHSMTGCCPKVAVHVLWDFPEGQDPVKVTSFADAKGVSIGAINPNLFQDQIYKFGSVCSPNPDAVSMGLRHVDDSIDLARQVGSRDISLWFADGSNYPGQDDIVRRKRAMSEALKGWHGKLQPHQRLLVEYKPFEPAFYHTDIADWGMSYVFAKSAGPQAKVLVDTGHHFQGANIEHIVAFLIDEGMLGGFHFNDRKYADDDLTLGSIDPYALFRIFHEILSAVEEQRVLLQDISFGIDQSHNLKPKIEAMVQSVDHAQSAFLRAALVDRAELAAAQKACDIVRAERCLRAAFETDVRDALGEWRQARGLDVDPVAVYRASGYQQQIDSERGPRNRDRQGGGGYA